jgi:thioredoxin 1
MTLSDPKDTNPMSAVPHAQDEADYDAFLNSDLPVLVDFTATWCGPCQAIAPMLDELHEELSGRLRIIKVDVDQLPAIAKRYDVMGIPALLLFDNNELLARMVGARTKQDLLGNLNALL